MSAERWKEVRTKIKQHRKRFHVGSKEYGRLSRMMGKVGRHIEYYESLIKPVYDLAKLSGLTTLSSAIHRGEKVIVFDAEWPYSFHPIRKMNEIGLVVFENGTTTIHNVQIGDYRKDGEFMHGHTTHLSDIKAKEWLRYQTNGAKCIVGHALTNDRKQLNEWGWYFPPNTIYADTSDWSQQMYSCKGAALKLHTLAQRMNVFDGHDMKKLHCAGNDAYLTWHVAQAIAHNAMKERNATETV